MDDLNSLEREASAGAPPAATVLEPDAPPPDPAVAAAEMELPRKPKSRRFRRLKQRHWKDLATIIGGVAFVSAVFAWVLLTFVFVEKPEDEVSLELPQNRIEAVMMELPIGGLTLENVSDRPPTAMIIEIDASITVHGTASELVKVEELLTSHYHRIQEAIDETVRFATPEQLEEPDMLTLRSRIRDQINEFFGEPIVKEVLFSHYRAFSTPIKR